MACAKVDAAEYCLEDSDDSERQIVCRGTRLPCGHAIQDILFHLRGPVDECVHLRWR
jgi:hypothetical protein